MFQITPHEDGFAVSWPLEQLAAARECRRELTLSGLRRGRDSNTGVVVHRYRNELETLQMLTDILTRLTIDFSVDSALEVARNAGQAEKDLIKRIRSNAEHRATSIAATLTEF